MTHLFCIPEQDLLFVVPEKNLLFAIPLKRQEDMLAVNLVTQDMSRKLLEMAFIVAIWSNLHQLFILILYVT